VAKRAPSALTDFAKLHREVEAVLQRVGRGTWDLVLVDVEGDWLRDEVETEEEAEAVCRQLGIRMHRGWGDPRLVRRMNGKDHWNQPGGRRRAL
jgi:hypothetical protein